jgi:hypothetical protein
MEPPRRKYRTTGPLDAELAREAKAIVALAFRNGPIEDLHAGIACPTCHNDSEYSRISETEMKLIIENAVNHVYRLLWQRIYDPESFARNVEFGERYAAKWNDPEA